MFRCLPCKQERILGNILYAMEMSEISVVIPLYNKEPHIARALDSVLNQTFQDFEIIVVDDGSTDRGAEIVRSYNDPRIRLIQQQNQRVSAARNKGVEEAEANLIAFLDADDEWFEKHLEVIIRLYTNYPEAGAFTTGHLRKESNNELVNPYYYGIPGEPWEGIIENYFLSTVLGEMPIFPSTVAIPKRILKDIGGFNINTLGRGFRAIWKNCSKIPYCF